jgi:penicillin-binding protein 1A
MRENEYVPDQQRLNLGYLLDPLENRYFHIPETVIAVPISGPTNTPSDLLGNNVYIEYYTPKGFKYYQSHPGQSPDVNNIPEGNNENPGNSNGAFVPQNPVPATRQKSEEVY